MLYQCNAEHTYFDVKRSLMWLCRILNLYWPLDYLFNAIPPLKTFHYHELHDWKTLN